MIKNALLITYVLLLLVVVPGVSVEKEATSQVTSYERREVRGVPLNIIYVNLDHPNTRITAAISKDGIGSRESFGSMVRRTQPTAAVTGTFFSKSNARPIGDIVIDGSRVHFGGMGTGLRITEDNKVSFVKVRWGHSVDWKGYKTVVCCGPRLVAAGKVDVDARGEGFRDPHVLGRGIRTAVGLTFRNRLVFVNTMKACSLNELAGIMKDLGCTEAVNFDGGASTAMYYKGRFITKPGRELTNVLLVYDTQNASVTTDTPQAIDQ